MALDMARTRFNNFQISIAQSGTPPERPWCIRDGNVVKTGAGPMYLVTGGGGGHLETPGPTRPPFQNNVQRGHHYCMVAINGDELELKTFDLKNRLFDYEQLTK